MVSERRRVAYYYDPDIGNYHYGQGHPMKPHRIRMTHNLAMNYGLYKKMDIFRPPPANFQDLSRFHSDDYLNFLRKVTPENLVDNQKSLQKFNVGEDCPAFDGVYEYSQISAGGSIGAAMKLNHGDADIAINWAGGLHHAKKSEASGFCYVNDIVLCILELLKYHERVVYIDIDVHHGDGVEEAFYTTDRVMTVSFHKYGEFFPGTGDIRDVGYGSGKYYAVNFPLRDGIDDQAYRHIFRPIMTKVMETYRPGAVVLQCGADSLAGDRLGCFNLSSSGHAECVSFMKSFGVPLVLLGGGGYTIRNVARVWAQETAIACNVSLEDTLPYNDYYEYFGPDYRLHIPSNNMDNLNTREYLDKYMTKVMEHLRHVQHAPGIQMQHTPGDLFQYISQQEERQREEDAFPDVRETERLRERRIVPDNEFYDDEDLGDKDLNEDVSSVDRKSYLTPRRSLQRPSMMMSNKREESAGMAGLESMRDVKEERDDDGRESFGGEREEDEENEEERQERERTTMDDDDDEEDDDDGADRYNHRDEDSKLGDGSIRSERLLGEDEEMISGDFAQVEAARAEAIRRRSRALSGTFEYQDERVENQQNDEEREEEEEEEGEEEDEKEEPEEEEEGEEEEEEEEEGNNEDEGNDNDTGMASERERYGRRKVIKKRVFGAEEDVMEDDEGETMDHGETGGGPRQ